MAQENDGSFETRSGFIQMKSKSKGGHGSVTFSYCSTACHGYILILLDAGAVPADEADAPFRKGFKKGVTE